MADDTHTDGPLSAADRAAWFADVNSEPGSPKKDPILSVDNVSRSFGGLKAVDVGHLEFQRGAITGLIGPNGAGKTTLFNLLTGFDRPDTGTWTMDGTNLAKLSPYKVARHGVVRTFQLTKALAKMSVLDNVKLGATNQNGERMLSAHPPVHLALARSGHHHPRPRDARRVSSSRPRPTIWPDHCRAGSANSSRWRGH